MTSVRGVRRCRGGRLPDARLFWWRTAIGMRSMLVSACIGSASIVAGPVVGAPAAVAPLHCLSADDYGLAPGGYALDRNPADELRNLTCARDELVAALAQPAHRENRLAMKRKLTAINVEIAQLKRAMVKPRGPT